MLDIKELIDEELGIVNGGNDAVADNPKGLVPGDKVWFYNRYWFLWMWGEFVSYDGNDYDISYDDTLIIIGSQRTIIEASCISVPEEDIR